MCFRHVGQIDDIRVFAVHERQEIAPGCPLHSGILFGGHPCTRFPFGQFKGFIEGDFLAAGQLFLKLSINALTVFCSDARSTVSMIFFS